MAQKALMMNAFDVLGMEVKQERQQGGQVRVQVPSEEEVKKRTNYLRVVLHPDLFTKAPKRSREGADELLEMIKIAENQLTGRNRIKHISQLEYYLNASGSSGEIENLKRQLAEARQQQGSAHLHTRIEQLEQLSQHLQEQLDLTTSAYAKAVVEVARLHKLTPLEYVKGLWKYRQYYPQAIFGFGVIMAVIYLIFLA